MLEGCACPGPKDEESDADGTNRIEKPYFLESCSDDGHYETERIDDDIITMINLVEDQ